MAAAAAAASLCRRRAGSLRSRVQPVFASTRARHLSVQVFNRDLKAWQRGAAANAPDFENYTYLKDEVASRLLERLDDIHESYSFADVVDLGSGTGHARRALTDRGLGIKRLMEIDSSEEVLKISGADAAGDNPPDFEVVQLHMSEEVPDLAPASADLICTSMALHWVNDLPGTLKTIRRALRPNGVFLGAFLGGETLAEMRSSFVLADLERRGGVQPHMSPLVSVADAGSLLQSAGFALPTVDTETIRIGYPDAFTLWHHIRSMGESNATLNRSSVGDMSSLLAAAAIHAEVYGDEGGIPASFQVIYMIGWGPHESQQKPLSRGSAKMSLKDLELDTVNEPEPSLPDPFKPKA